jgi:hypothetical protein
VGEGVFGCGGGPGDRWEAAGDRRELLRPPADRLFAAAEAVLEAIWKRNQLERGSRLSPLHRLFVMARMEPNRTASISIAISERLPARRHHEARLPAARRRYGFPQNGGSRKASS